MNEQLRCSCVICQSERSLLLDLGKKDALEKYQELASKLPILSGFPTARALLLRLRVVASDDDQEGVADALLGELFRPSPKQDQELQQHLVLLILMPALHKASRQLMAGFPSIPREDIAQHLLTTVLEILRSKAMRNQQSHFAFMIIRMLRRNSFRWALRETKFGANSEPEAQVMAETKGETDMSFETKLFLRNFLHRCLSNRQITQSEYELLIAFKVEKIDAGVLAAREDLSEIAFRHRLQRIINRLRKIAQYPLPPAKRPAASAAGSAESRSFISAA